jgi:acetyl esterase/lipase
VGQPALNGARAIAPNYRLAPQYPFPCALQDFLASCAYNILCTDVSYPSDGAFACADLFLIQPPEGAAHRPVKPSNIVIGGDSAGGGLTLALLQVIRDAGLPQPAGAVLVSPWCDLHHSFPSIFLNTDTVSTSSSTV